MMQTQEETMAPCYKEIAENIKKLRKTHSLTQKELSDMLDINPQYYARLERADDPQRHFTLDKILLACRIFDVTPNQVMTRLPDVACELNIRKGIQDDIRKKMKGLTTEQLKNLNHYMNEVNAGKNHKNIEE